MSDHFDRLETRDPAARQRQQLGQLARQIAHAKAHAPAFARILADVDPAAITTYEALARIPVTRKSELLELQKSDRPFGGFAAPEPGTGAQGPFSARDRQPTVGGPEPAVGTPEPEVSAWEPQAQGLKQLGPDLAKTFKITHYNLSDGRPQSNDAVLEVKSTAGLVRTMDRAKPRTHPRNSTIAAPLPKLEDLGVTKKQSATSAAVPEAVLDQLTAPPASA